MRKQVWMRLGLAFTLSAATALQGQAADPGIPPVERQEEKKGSAPSPGLPHPWDGPGPSSRVLHAGPAQAAGMRQEPLDTIDSLIASHIEDGHIPGAVVLVARRGVIVKEAAYGHAALYADDLGTPLESPVVMRTDTLFDVASISKLFTAVAVMQLAEKGVWQLDDPVVRHLPDFGENGKEQVTIRQLLTHTSGFEPFIPLYRNGNSREERLQSVLRHPLRHPPGERYVYSDLNYLVLGALVEKVSGKLLDEFVREHITGPLGMKDTMYNPPASLTTRTAATEYRPWTGRGLVWGEVHDENAWGLDGVAGHAGVFSTARDLAVFAQMMLNDGVYGGKRILSPESAANLIQNHLPQFPGDDHGLGFELNQGWYMDALTDARSFGHTGFTGTSLVVSPTNQTVCILLTNRVHPTRNTLTINPIRREVARQTALAIPVASTWRDGVWFAGMGDEQEHTLTAAVDLPEGGSISFDTWYRIEWNADAGWVEVSPDGFNWSGLQVFTGESDWQEVSCALPPGTRFVRFRYLTDTTINGRGWYVHAPRVRDETGRERAAEWEAFGWEREKR